MRRSAPFRTRKLLRRQAKLERRTALRRLTPLRRSPYTPASEAQRAKVAGRPCLVCGGRPVDPAHLVPRSLGGCDEPDCVVSLCRPCHRAYDRGELDLLPHLEPRYRAELAHAARRLSLLALLRLVTGTRWRPVDARQPADGGERMSPMTDPFAAVPEGMRWCPHCNGYGSSLKEAAEHCTHCSGTGLVVDEAAALSAEHGGNGSPTGDEPRRG